MITWIQGKVLENIHCTDKLFSLKVDADIECFKAGQFTRLGLDINGERVTRPYSFKNSPDEKVLEFYISTIPDGLLSNKLRQLTCGDSVWIRPKATGLFTLDTVPVSDDLWMLATGTGIAPFLSILKSKEAWCNYRHIILVYAVRLIEDISFRNEIDLLEQQYNDQLSTVLFVSREEVENTIAGRIPHAISASTLEDRVSRNLCPSTSQVMLCGNPGMVKDTTNLLLTRGFKLHRRHEPGQITFEKYW